MADVFVLGCKVREYGGMSAFGGTGHITHNTFGSTHHGVNKGISLLHL